MTPHITETTWWMTCTPVSNSLPPRKPNDEEDEQEDEEDKEDEEDDDQDKEPPVIREPDE